MGTPGELKRSEIELLSRTHPIVFFDGVCGLCNAFVDWTMKRDPAGRIRFTPLQGESALMLLEAADRMDLDTVVVVKNVRTFRRSDAIIEVLLELPGVWPAAAKLLRAVPRPLRDLGYGLVVRVRYRLFGRREACRIPSREERARFLP